MILFLQCCPFICTFLQPLAHTPFLSPPPYSLQKQIENFITINLLKWKLYKEKLIKKHKGYLLLFLPNVLYLFFSSSGANKIAYDSGDRNLCKIFIDLKLPTQKFECYDSNISLYYYLFLSVLKSGVCVCTPSMENGHLVYTCSWSWSLILIPYINILVPWQTP